MSTTEKKNLVRQLLTANPDTNKYQVVDASGWGINLTEADNLIAEVKTELAAERGVAEAANVGSATIAIPLVDVMQVIVAAPAVQEVPDGDADSFSSFSSPTVIGGEADVPGLAEFRRGLR